MTDVDATKLDLALAEIISVAKAVASKRFADHRIALLDVAEIAYKARAAYRKATTP